MLKGNLLILLISLCCTISSQSNGQTRGAVLSTDNKGNSSSGTTYAIIVGISKYQYVNNLNFADKDALLVYDFLTDKAGGSVMDSNIYVLLNEQAKAATFWVQGMGWLKRKNLKAGDKLFIYLAGHGDAINDEEYFFLTYDCAPQGSKDNYLVTGNIPLYNLKVRIAEMTKKGVDVFLIMDACRTDELPGGKEGQQSFLNSIVEKKAGEIIMLSAGPNQEAIEAKIYGNGHGLFTYFLIDGLIGLADQEGEGDKNGVVTLYELSSWVQKKVKSEAQSRFKRTQIPYFCCSERELSAISRVDSLALKNWTIGGTLSASINRDIKLAASSSRSVFYNPKGEYNEIIASFFTKLNKGDLLGKNNSAEYYLGELVKKPETEQIISELNNILGIELINYAQQKINVYVLGKDIDFIHKTSTLYKTDNFNEEITENLIRVNKVSKESFYKAYTYLEKGIKLIKEDEEYLRSLNSKLLFLKAKCYFEQTATKPVTLSEALAISQDAIRFDSTLSYNYELLASLQIENKNYQEAASSLKKALSLNPNWQYLYNDLGYVYIQQNKYAEAKSVLQDMIKLDSTNSSYLNNLGAALFNLGEIERASFYFNRSLFYSPDFSSALNNLGISYKKLKQTEKAKKYLLLAIQNDKGNCNGYYNLGNLYLELGDLKNAEQYLTTAYKCDTSSIDYKLALANIYLIQKKLGVARDFLQQAISQNPNNYTALIKLGDISSQEEKYPEAEKYYKKALAIDSTMAAAHLNLGSIYLKTNNLIGAEREYKLAASYSPNNSVVYFNLGLLYQRQEKTDLAEKNYLKTLEFDSTNVSALINLGQIYAQSNRLDEAERAFKKVIKLDSKNSIGFNNLGNIYYSKDDLTNAEKNYLIALKLNPKNKAIYNNLISIYTRQNRKEKVHEMTSNLEKL